MTNLNNDPLADLGLEDMTSGGTPADDQVSTSDTASDTWSAPVEQDTPADNDQEETVSDDIDFEFGTITEIPTMRRLGGGGGRESKYKFDDLAAPAPIGKGKDAKIEYGQFIAKVPLARNGKPVEGEELKRFKRSVQSATTAENRKDGDKYYITRAIERNGAFYGIQVIRTDNPPKKGEEEGAAE